MNRAALRFLYVYTLRKRWFEDSAAKELGVNAVELAECLADDGIEALAGVQTRDEFGKDKEKAGFVGVEELSLWAAVTSVL